MQRRLFLQITTTAAGLLVAGASARADEIDARDAGLAGDGETDDSAALQAVIDDATGDLVLTLGEGTWLLGSTIFLDVPGAAVSIAGAGASLTTLRLASGDDPLADVGATASSPVARVSLSNLRVESGVSPNIATAIGEIGLRLGAVEEVHLEDVVFADLDGNVLSEMIGHVRIQLAA